MEPYLYRAGLGDEWPADEAVVADPFSDVHNGGATFGFVDGHTKWYPCEQLQAGREPEGLRDLTRRQRRLNPAGE
ncbi:MAG: hypothetical protein H5T86_02860 [Armatimonadetes bacterium]|nr:hypothetical protein [Armatimonadota bacterium]